jgi:hypothetical protein
MSILPVGKDTIIYGSCDAGRNIHAIDPELNKLMAKAAKMQNLKPHECRIAKKNFKVCFWGEGGGESGRKRGEGRRGGRSRGEGEKMKRGARKDRRGSGDGSVGKGGESKGEEKGERSQGRKEREEGGRREGKGREKGEKREGEGRQS